MNPQKRVLLWLIAIGGAAVLASYAWFLIAHPDLGGEFWGGVPAWMKPAYLVSMLLAASGFFAFTRFVLRRRPAQVEVAGRFGYGIFKWIYTLILVPSALWMPLTFLMIQGPNPALWFSIRLTLATVGIGSLLMIAALLRMQPRARGASFRFAVLGSIAFSFQTAVLDALIWPAFFPV
jgi:hypothetical protein